MLPVHSWQSRQDCFRLVARIQGFDSRSVLCTYVMWEQVYTGPLFAFWDYDCFQKHKQELEYVALFLLNRHSGRFESTTFVFGGGITSIRLSPIEFVFLVLFFENKDIFVCSFYYSTCKFDRANDEFDRTRRFKTSYNCYHQERFQIFSTTPIGATSTNFVVKRDLQNFGSTCGSLRKSFWRHDMKNTQPHLKVWLSICRTFADSQWNAVYNAFHRIFCCGNETICR